MNAEQKEHGIPAAEIRADAQMLRDRANKIEKGEG